MKHERMGKTEVSAADRRKSKNEREERERKKKTRSDVVERREVAEWW